MYIYIYVSYSPGHRAEGVLDPVLDLVCVRSRLVFPEVPASIGDARLGSEMSCTIIIPGPLWAPSGPLSSGY